MVFLFIFLMGSFVASTAFADNILIDFFQEHISAVDGNRCGMYPSCSSYASQAIEKHGPIIGWIMACDRLVRCGRDETKTSMRVVINNQQYSHDPLEANDFWWFEKDNKK
ncbi:MAG: membrane protein insertion efficiency factor YidD [Desulfobacteraceae bacterium]|nr:membrane protein insertion efficiency factor YidD [Desulfobacteraceae bacterium]